MRNTRREYLSELAEREIGIMSIYYKSKKKMGKKTLQKIQQIKKHNLEKILDEYFYGVCYNFFKRQM